MVERGVVVSVDDSVVNVKIGSDFCLACAVDHCSLQASTIRARLPHGVTLAPGDRVEVNASAYSALKGAFKVFVIPVVVGLLLGSVHWALGAAGGGAVLTVFSLVGRGRSDLPFVGPIQPS